MTEKGLTTLLMTLLADNACEHTSPEVEHLHRLVLAGLQAQGHIDASVSESTRREGRQLSSSQIPDSEGDDIQ